MTAPLAGVVLLRAECAVATDAQAKISRVNIALFMVFSHPSRLNFSLLNL